MTVSNCTGCAIGKLPHANTSILIAVSVTPCPLAQPHKGRVMALKCCARPLIQHPSETPLTPGHVLSPPSSSAKFEEQLAIHPSFPTSLWPAVAVCRAVSALQASLVFPPLECSTYHPLFFLQTFIPASQFCLEAGEMACSHRGPRFSSQDPYGHS